MRVSLLVTLDVHDQDWFPAEVTSLVATILRESAVGAESDVFTTVSVELVQALPEIFVLASPHGVMYGNDYFLTKEAAEEKMAQLQFKGLLAWPFKRGTV